MLTKNEELEIFRKVNGKNKVVKSNYVDRYNSNTIMAGIYNQGVAKRKLREFIEKENLNFHYWIKQR